jgi:uncharacterized SAM-binding protein YcdF (DUF218 family)
VAGESTDLGDVVLADEGIPFVWILIAGLGIIATVFVVLFLRRPRGKDGPDLPEGGNGRP